MSKSLKFTTLDAAAGKFEDLPWQANDVGDVWIYNSKTDEWVPVAEVQYIISIADRYEVRDEPPANAHPVE